MADDLKSLHVKGQSEKGKGKCISRGLPYLQSSGSKWLLISGFGGEPESLSTVRGNKVHHISLAYALQTSKVECCEFSGQQDVRHAAKWIGIAFWLVLGTPRAVTGGLPHGRPQVTYAAIIRGGTIATGRY